MYGPGNSFLLRQASEDMYFENVPILKNTLLNYNSYGNSYNPKYYDEPEKFRPERWES